MILVEEHKKNINFLDPENASLVYNSKRKEDKELPDIRLIAFPKKRIKKQMKGSIDCNRLSFAKVNRNSFAKSMKIVRNVLPHVGKDMINFNNHGIFVQKLGESFYHNRTVYDLKVMFDPESSYCYEVFEEGSHFKDRLRFAVYKNQHTVIQETSKLVNIFAGKKTRQKIQHINTEPEKKARETLRLSITEKEYRRYLTNGFIMVRGHLTGEYYQIFNNQKINVYKKGVKIKTICTHIDNSMPPTDFIVFANFLLENDEKEFLRFANINPVCVSLL